MIVNVRGTSGSGKSHLVKQVMQCYLYSTPRHVEGRKQPLYYECQHPRKENNLFVLGHYATACGGCDTISKDPFDTVFGLVEQLAQHGDVMFEGLLVSAEQRRTKEKLQKDAVIIGLSTPLEECLASIGLRRAERGDERPLNPENTTKRYNSLERMYPRLKAEGLNVLRFSREEALAFVREAFGV